MNIQQRITRILGALLIAGLCVTPEMMQAAQQNSQSAAPQTPATRPQGSNQGSSQEPQAATQPNGQSQQQNKPQGSGTTIDPSQAPLQPVTTYPDAPTPQQDQHNGVQPVQGAQSGQSGQDQSKQAQQPQKPVTEPAGAAAAEKVPTTGGAASRPAGVAIAPAKQHQARSLLIKIGAVAAAGVAAGTVYGLSRGTPSTPGLAGATRK
jgi:hypothetical protein